VRTSRVVPRQRFTCPRSSSAGLCELVVVVQKDPKGFTQRRNVSCRHDATRPERSHYLAEPSNVVDDGGNTRTERLQEGARLIKLCAVGKDGDRGGAKRKLEVGLPEIPEAPFGAVTGRAAEWGEVDSGVTRDEQACPGDTQNGVDRIRQSLVVANHTKGENRVAVVRAHGCAAKDGMRDDTEFCVRHAEPSERAVPALAVDDDPIEASEEPSPRSRVARRSARQQVVGREDERGSCSHEPGVRVRSANPLQMCHVARGKTEPCQRDRVLECLDCQSRGRPRDPRGDAVQAVVDRVAGGLWHGAVPEPRGEQAHIRTVTGERPGERVVVGRGVRGRIGKKDAHRPPSVEKRAGDGWWVRAERAVVQDGVMSAPPTIATPRGFEDARAQFPVLERIAYLNAGTFGPLSRSTVDALQAEIAQDFAEGRSGRPYFECTLGLRETARESLASLVGVEVDHVGLTSSTTDGCNIVVAGLDLQPGDEVVTTTEEHFGMLGPLHASGARIVVTTPDAEAIVAAVTPRTRLLALSQVLWTTGRVLPVRELRETTGVPVLVDGAQSVGAIPVSAAGLDFLTISGQKWLCGPDSTGGLVVADPERLRVSSPSYFAQTGYDLDGTFTSRPGAARFDPNWISTATLAGLLAAIAERPEWAFTHAATVADRCRDRLAEIVEVVTPVDRSTLVAFRPDREPAEVVAELHEAGVHVREIPGSGLVRVSCGWWTSEGDLDRLVAALGS